MTPRKSRAGATGGGRRARPRRDAESPPDPEVPAAGAEPSRDGGASRPRAGARSEGDPPGAPDPSDADLEESVLVAEGLDDAVLEALEDDGSAAAGVRAERPSYDEIRRLLAGVIREASGLVEAQESVCGILYDELEHFSWVGIYMVDGDELELAAWAGPEETEHVRIPIGEGICGAAAASGETEVVPDVREDERFIACFPSTRSEIVVPIFRAGEVVGEIDVDSDELDAFDERDVRLLEWTASRLGQLV
jgi:GAF domain-containing protein